MPTKRDPDRSALALFADEMRAARDRAGLTQDELAARVNYSGTLVAMVECLKRVPQADLAARLDDALDTPARLLGSRNGCAPCPSRLVPAIRSVRRPRRGATQLSRTLVPGLLQTWITRGRCCQPVPNISQDEVDERVAAGWRGKRSWTATTRRTVGGAGRRCTDPRDRRTQDDADQFRHLADMAARPNITIQVIPSPPAGTSGCWAPSSSPTSPILQQSPPGDGRRRTNNRGRRPRSPESLLTFDTSGPKPCPAKRPGI